MKHTTFKNVVLIITTSLISAFIAVLLSSRLNPQDNNIIVSENQEPKHYSILPPRATTNTDFIDASAKAIDAVVHVTVLIEHETYGYNNPLLNFFFGNGGQPQKHESMGAGSGVIISEDGYIVTNNHVIDNSKTIKIVLNDNRSYSAKLVGTDPLTDIALIKLENSENETFPTLTFGNSEELRVGEWVLAVGNPFSLSTTVTAGIVSAKGRNMYNMQNNGSKMGIESFIQTDAAVNPGNSGGALVNTNGELIGINTAIASPTGSYAGYSFAVPSTIVKKVVTDLMEYGEIKRAYMGISITDVNKQLAEKENLNTLTGVYISGLSETGAAKKAGIKVGDVVIKINNKKTNSISELQEQVNRYRPGDVISTTILRGKEEKTFNLILRDEYGNTEMITNNSLASLGAEVIEIPDTLKKKLNIGNGVQIVKLNDGKFKSIGIKSGYIITKINNQTINNIDDIIKIIENVSGGLFISGLYPNGSVSYYAINMDE